MSYQELETSRIERNKFIEQIDVLVQKNQQLEQELQQVRGSEERFRQIADNVRSNSKFESNRGYRTRLTVAQQDRKKSEIKSELIYGSQSA
ncbi:hypothetical protein Xen7305DRAFT_00048680 [Xenococcus sp. PCC 7305]|uniref:hypothetical protein n=1 Tax=Xenococcus sp. PCC 7305 TaxID=102125 RepID=UPI0002ACF4F1|nr:hypothetical protein [Xenococcus sp. PCC 7305]ELS05128.1 hypothetical protein Xen7305DRAFT_00048680 [Xenococcus sp. PCC 7305]